ncbi:hypothetical protein [Halopseudomonas oceani]|uniref:hypothetical protein n=1 Tax=Halopseudomonas oceani TaxID=1708783 RepID=UPI002AA73114|nr:hypothetical protein [Halopseudomonas oceani]
MKIFLLAMAFITLLFGIVAAYMVWGYGWKASTNHVLEYHKSERSAAYGGRNERVPLEVVGTIDHGRDVAVLYDTYGKDYWACYVRTTDLRFGWVLCTDLTAN